MATSKKLKIDVHYREGSGTRRCKNCVMFRPPSSCTDVVGVIEPEDVCDIFARKKDATY